jgi:hypothetical protein
MSWNDNGFFAPEAMIDGNGRQIMWAWVFDYRPNHMVRKSGMVRNLFPPKIFMAWKRWNTQDKAR